MSDERFKTESWFPENLYIGSGDFPDLLQVTCSGEPNIYSRIERQSLRCARIVIEGEPADDARLISWFRTARGLHVELDSRHPGFGGRWELVEARFTSGHPAWSRAPREVELPPER